MVLQFLRRKMQLILKITVILIVPAFVIYFGSSRIRGIREGQEVAGQMFGEDIPMKDFLDAFNWVRFWVYLTRGPEEAPYIDLKSQVRDYLILTHEANRLGIEVSDSEVASAIATLPFFQKNGTFSRELYIQFLTTSGISPQIFESHVRKMLAISKLSSLLSDCAKVSFWEVVDEYLARNRQMSAKVVLFKPSDFVDQVSVSEEEAKAYFEEHKEEFKIPERISVKFVHIDPATLAKPQISEEEVKEYYNLHSQDYHKPERVSARMILIKLPANASADEESAAWEKARTIMERLRKGEDFATLARELSEDEVTKASGGDLGIIEKGKLEKQMDDLLFSLKEGEFDVVRTSQGLAILKVEKKYPPIDKSLEEVKDEIAAKIAEQKRWEKAEDIAYDVIYDLEDGLDLESAAANNKLKVYSPTPFAFGDNIEGVKDGLAFCMEVFSLEEGEYTKEPIKLSDGYYVAQLVARYPSKQATFEEAREDVEKRIKYEKAKEIAKQKAEEFHKLLKSPQDLEKVAEKQGFKVIDTGMFPRRGYIPQVGFEPKLSRALYHLNPGELTDVVEIDAGYAVARLEEKKEATFDKFAETAPGLENAMLTQKKGRIYEYWYNKTIEEANFTLTDKAASLIPEPRRRTFR